MNGFEFMENKKTKTVVVIGGGPSGMMAAGTAAAQGNSVILLEKSDKVGRKLFITGKGRCNVTNASDPEELIQNVFGNPYFLYSAFYTFDSSAVIDFFEQLGVPMKVERGRRVFPKSDKSNDIVKAMEKFLKKNNVDLRLNTEVQSLIYENSILKGVVTKDGKNIYADAVIIATGGLSYPATGSTGDGFRFAENVNHKVTKLYPSLVPLKAEEEWCGRLQGLSLKNISMSIEIDGKVIYKDFGEMMFTHYGITGPLVLTGSRYIIDKSHKKPVISIDLKPALEEKELDSRLLRDFEKNINRVFKNSLDELLPQKIIPVIIELSGILPNKKVNEITKEERKRLCKLLKNLKLTVFDTVGFSEAVVTAGGVCTDEIDPATMKSKIVPNLSFAGEVIDVDAFTGGFNLQIAFSTGYIAGMNI